MSLDTLRAAVDDVAQELETLREDHTAAHARLTDAGIAGGDLTLAERVDAACSELEPLRRFRPGAIGAEYEKARRAIGARVEGSFGLARAEYVPAGCSAEVRRAVAEVAALALCAISIREESDEYHAARGLLHALSREG